MSITSRMYHGEEDYQRMRDMVSETCRLANGTPGSPGDLSIGDLDWWRSTDDGNTLEMVRLWLDGSGQVVAFTWPAESQTDVVVYPGHRDVEEEVFAWAAKHRAGMTPAEGEENTLTVWAVDGDEHRIDILTRLGFQRQDSSLIYRRRSIEGDLPVAPLAEGYTFRDMTGDADLEQRVEVHRSAFHPSKMTVEKHRRVMSSPTYRPELDIVAVAPDGAYAAYCIIWYDPACRLGVFEPVGCHADHRKRGLASAVMVEGMRRVRARGAHTVGVTALGSEEASNRLYKSLGFQRVAEIHSWSKTFGSA